MAAELRFTAGGLLASELERGLLAALALACSELKALCRARRRAETQLLNVAQLLYRAQLLHHPLVVASRRIAMRALSRS